MPGIPFLCQAFIVLPLESRHNVDVIGGSYEVRYGEFRLRIVIWSLSVGGGS